MLSERKATMGRRTAMILSSSSVDGNMSRRRKKAQGNRSAATKSAVAAIRSTFDRSGRRADRLRRCDTPKLRAGGSGQDDKARRIYSELDAVLAGAESEARLRALIRNDLAAIAAMEGRFDEARAGWQAALEIDPDCLMARLNRDLIEAEMSFGQTNGELGELKLRRRHPVGAFRPRGGRWPAGPDGGRRRPWRRRSSTCPGRR